MIKNGNNMILKTIKMLNASSFLYTIIKYQGCWK